MPDQYVACPKCGHTGFHGHALVWVEVKPGGAGYSFNWREVPNFGPYCSKCGAYVGTASAEKLRTEMEHQLARFQAGKEGA